MAVKVKQHKGKWWVFIDHKGKRKAKCVGSKQAAETAARKIEAKLTLGDFSLLDEKPQTPLFAEYATRWLEIYAKVHLKPGTWRRYSNDIRLHLTPTFGHKRLDAITRQDIRTLIAAKREAGLAWNSVRNFICPLREMLNHAVDDGVLAIHSHGKNCACILRRCGNTSPRTTRSSLPSHALGYDGGKPLRSNGMRSTGTGASWRCSIPTATPAAASSPQRTGKRVVWT
jgi:hypothetical protein